ncbi:hypothetical protein ABFZ85_14615 [Hyphococcus formosus]|uniref:hypothetical protein n=1 Tax=Hyphococcus formosus TaxID=3143534 RepID=UPI00398AE039
MSIDTSVADKNAEIFPEGIDSNTVSKKFVHVALQFTESQTQKTAEKLYCTLCANHFRKEIVEKIATQILKVEERLATLSEFLTTIVPSSPHWVAVSNSLKLLRSLESLPDDGQIIFLARSSHDIQFIQDVPSIPSHKELENDGLVFSLAKAGCWEAHEEIIDGLTSECPDPVKEWVLRHGYESVSTSEVFGENTSEYISYIQNLIENVDMRGAVRMPFIDNELAVGILHFMSNIASEAATGVVWSDPELFACETDILFRLIDHLEGRELDTSALNSLAHIYEELLSPDRGKIILRSHEHDLDLTMKILAIFDFEPNRIKIDAALSSTQSPGFIEALAVAVKIRGYSKFDTLLETLKADFPQRNSTPIRTGLIAQLADSIRKRNEAERASQWCINYFQIHNDGYSAFSREPDFGQFVSILLQVNARYSGVAPPLVLAGLNNIVATRAAANLLLEWEGKDHPEGVSLFIENTINDHKMIVDKLRSIKGIRTKTVLH